MAPRKAKVEDEMTETVEAPKRARRDLAPEALGFSLANVTSTGDSIAAVSRSSKYEVYKDALSASWESGEAMRAEGIADTEALLHALRSAAAQMNIGVDTRVPEDGVVVFQAREKRVVKRKAKDAVSAE